MCVRIKRILRKIDIFTKIDQLQNSSDQLQNSLIEITSQVESLVRGLAISINLQNQVLDRLDDIESNFEDQRRELEFEKKKQK